MANAVVYRYDAPNTEQPHGAIKKTSGATSNVEHLKQCLDADRADFGGGATGNVLNAAGASAVAALGAFIDCEGKSLICFKLEYSANTGTRRFNVVVQDWNATAGLLVRPEVIEPANLALNGSSTPALATLAAAYFHAEAIIVSCLGMKQVTLLLLAGDAGSPTVHAWGSAI